MSLSIRITVTAAQPAAPWRAARTSWPCGPALAAPVVASKARCGNAGLVLQRERSAIAATPAICAATAIPAVAAGAAIFIVFATLAIAAVAARPAIASRTTDSSIAASSAGAVDVHAGDVLRHDDGQGTTRLARETIGSLRPVRPVVPAAAGGSRIVSVPMAGGILPLTAGSAHLTAGAVYSASARLAGNVDVVDRHCGPLLEFCGVVICVMPEV
jgi:hypothetical protein